MQIKWVKLSTFSGPSEAELVRQLLGSQGMPTQLRSRVPHQVFPLSVTRLAEVEVWVDEADRKRAADLIAEQRRIGFRILSDEEQER